MGLCLVLNGRRFGDVHISLYRSSDAGLCAMRHREVDGCQIVLVIVHLVIGSVSRYPVESQRIYSNLYE